MLGNAAIGQIPLGGFGNASSFTVISFILAPGVFTLQGATTIWDFFPVSASVTTHGRQPVLYTLR